MEKSFLRARYKHESGYFLTHTIGSDASSSTRDYLHYNISYVLLFFLQGKGQVKIEGQQYTLLPGDLVFIDPSELFCISIDGTCFHERIILRVDGRFFSNFSQDCTPLFDCFRNREKGIGNRIPAKSLAQAGIDQRIRKLVALQEGANPRDELQSICTIVDILAEINRLCKELDISMRNPTSQSALIQGVMLHLGDHFREPISVTSVADSFGITGSYLSHYFKEHTGMSLWHYVLLRRLHLANELLKRGCSAEEACMQSGFQNYANFYRLYKKHIGMTPIQYRQQYSKQ